MSSASASWGASVGVGDHQLDLVALPVGEDQARRPGRVQPQQLGVDLVLGQALEPVLGGVVGADPQHDPLDVAVAGQLALELLELQERDDAAGIALLVAVVRVVAERRLEVQRLLDEPEAEDSAPEVDVGSHVGGHAGEVMDAVQPGLGHDSLPRRSAARRVRSDRISAQSGLRYDRRADARRADRGRTDIRQPRRGRRRGARPADRPVASSVGRGGAAAAARAAARATTSTRPSSSRRSTRSATPTRSPRSATPATSSAATGGATRCSGSFRRASGPRSSTDRSPRCAAPASPSTASGRPAGPSPATTWRCSPRVGSAGVRPAGSAPGIDRDVVCLPFAWPLIDAYWLAPRSRRCASAMGCRSSRLPSSGTWRRSAPSSTASAVPTHRRSSA